MFLRTAIINQDPNYFIILLLKGGFDTNPSVRIEVKSPTNNITFMPLDESNCAPDKINGMGFGINKNR